MHRHDSFTSKGFQRGAPLLVEIAWIITKNFFFLSSWPWPSSLKSNLLRLFGARVGKGLYIRPRVNIHFPWKLSLGSYCWIGDRCEILNLEHVCLMDHVALAHDVYLAAASHDVRSRSMCYKNRPIMIKSGTWIATRAFVGPGVVIGKNCVIGACSVVMKDVIDDSLVLTDFPVSIQPRILDRV